ncbi:hypothetical protein HK097_010878 [Rhizophlyctis rosea]|uniref:Pentacotripeptide-repeat region of PRORP domain-containing protein n=1 Tax=Rhizophlyctis rosea TaxID=64517 RepID=A0AAD5S9D2_9FUNG|nr:hypothetical protein HK097_010878 [Rhizophlyctis rosea]
MHTAKKPYISKYTYTYLRNAIHSFHRNPTPSCRCSPQPLRYSSTSAQKAATDSFSPPPTNQPKYKRKSPLSRTLKPIPVNIGPVDAVARTIAWTKYLQNIRTPRTKFSSPAPAVYTPYDYAEFKNILDMLEGEPDVNLKLHNIKTVIHHMYSYGVAITDHVRCVLAKALAEANHLDQAIKKLETMIDTKQWATPEAHAAILVLLDRCLRSGNGKIADRILSGILATDKGLHQFEQTDIFKIVETFLVQGDMAGADDALIRLYTAGWIPSANQTIRFIEAHDGEEQSGGTQFSVADADESIGNTIVDKRALYANTLSTIVRIGQVILADVRLNSKNDSAQKRFLFSQLTSEALKRDGVAQALTLATGADPTSLFASNAYRLLVQHEINQGNLDRAEKLYDSQVARGVTPQTTTINILMTAFIDAGKRDKFLKYAKEVGRLPIEPNLVYYNILLRYHLSHKDDSAAQSIFLEMRKRGINPDTNTFRHLMFAYILRGDVQRAVSLFHNAAKEFDIPPGVDLYNTMLSGCVGPEGADMPLAKSIWADMRRQEISPTDTTFQKLLHVCAATVPPDLEAASEWVHAARRLRVHLNRRAFNNLMSVYAKSGDVESVRFILRQMRETGFAPDAEAYNILITGWMKVRRMDRCEEVLEVMKEENVQPNVVTMNILITGWVNNGQLGTAVKWYRHFVGERGVKPDAMTFMILVRAHVNAGDVAMARRLWSSMRVRGIDGGIEVWNRLLVGIAMAEGVEGIETWVRSMGKDGIGMNVKTLGSIVRGCGRSGRMDVAVEWVDRFEKKFGIRPNVEVYNSLIKGFADTGNLTAAEEWFRAMIDARQLPLLETYNMILGGYAKCGETRKMEDWFERILDGGLQPTYITYTIIINYFAKRGDWTKCQQWYGRLLSEHPEELRSPAIFNTMVHAHVVHSKGLGGEESMRWWDEMLKQGIKPDSYSYGCLMSVYGRSGLIPNVLTLFEKLLKGGDDVHGSGMMQPTVCVVLDALGWHGEVDVMIKSVWPRILAGECGFKPEENAWASYMEALIRNGKMEMGWDVVLGMEKAGIRPGGKTMATWTSMTERMADKRWVEMGWEKIDEWKIRKEVDRQREAWVEARKSGERWVGRTGPWKGRL